MNQFLQMGANTVLHSPKGNVTVSYEITNSIDISLTAFLLTESDKVQGDSGIIFYNRGPTDKTQILYAKQNLTKKSRIPIR